MPSLLAMGMRLEFSFRAQMNLKTRRHIIIHLLAVMAYAEATHFRIDQWSCTESMKPWRHRSGFTIKNSGALPKQPSQRQSA